MMAYNLVVTQLSEGQAFAAVDQGTSPWVLSHLTTRLTCKLLPEKSIVASKHAAHLSLLALSNHGWPWANVRRGLEAHRHNSKKKDVLKILSCLHHLISSLSHHWGLIENDGGLPQMQYTTATKTMSQVESWIQGIHPIPCP